ncbi:MaoC/PaaZ C-terminal domain-containing protein [Pseudoramibacter sp. HA2172]|uniref:MaoC/PaaZ C-terminal domain-containing protein n=1 Tax=Pseudoramibacter faecis TaxID=3108534 RepID=UPI002E77FA79|nr:MaoC/PaaZ C-terminal domain-containing protein [Pseudoramibacter sp. HA2172]
MRRSFYYLNEFKVGDRFTTLSRTVTETDVVLFAGITGDNNPIHTDRTYAEALPFGSRIAHGLLGAGIATGLWGRMGLVDGSAIAALSTEWQFVGAIKIGDTIHCEIEVLEAKRSKSKPDRGILNIGYRIVNQDDKLCQTGSMATMLYWCALEEEA